MGENINYRTNWTTAMEFSIFICYFCLGLWKHKNKGDWKILVFQLIEHYNLPLCELQLVVRPVCKLCDMWEYQDPHIC